MGRGGKIFIIPKYYFAPQMKNFKSCVNYSMKLQLNQDKNNNENEK